MLGSVSFYSVTLQRDVKLTSPCNIFSPHIQKYIIQYEYCVIRMRITMFVTVSESGTVFSFNSTIAIQEIWWRGVKNIEINTRAYKNCAVLAYEWIVYTEHTYTAFSMYLNSVKCEEPAVWKCWVRFFLLQQTLLVDANEAFLRIVTSMSNMLS